MAIVEVLENGKSLGSWLLSPILDPQEVKTANGQVVRMGLRFKRYYLPFTVKLLKATHEIYPGTATDMNPEGIPKNFQSRVQIDNPTTGDNREVDIYMNNPLRYAGLTFFQYQMGQDEMASGNAVGTSTLQVVRNPSWLTPYFGCAIVALGMVYQFLYHLVRFIGRRGKQPPAVPSEKKGKAKKQEQPVAVA
jgi:cytochrome c biogenesis protein ResB